MLRNQKHYRMSGSENIDTTVEVDISETQEIGTEVETSDSIPSIKEQQNTLSLEIEGEQNIDMRNMQALLERMIDNFENSQARLRESFASSQARLREDLRESLKEDLKENFESSQASLRQDLKENFENSQASLRQDMKENFENSQARLKEDLTENLRSLQDNLGHVQNNIESMEGRIGSNLTSLKTDIKNEISRVENNILEVRGSITEVRSQVEARIVNLQTELDNQMDTRMENLQAEVNRRVESTAGSLHSQIDSVNTQMSSLNELVNNLQTVTQSIETSTRSRIVDLEREVIKINEMSNEKLKTLGKEINDVHKKLKGNENRSGNGENQPMVSECVDAGPGCSRSSESVLTVDGATCRNESECVLPNVGSIRPPSSILNDLVIPSYSNRAGQNPVKFLNSLETYFELKSISEAHKMLIVKSALTGPALAWRELVLGPNVPYAEFRRKFLSYYWNNSKQEELRSRLNQGKFSLKGRLSMEDYFLELGQAALLLDPPLTTVEFIDTAARHFPPEIRNALVVARPQTFEETVALLKQLQGRTGVDRSHENRMEKERGPKGFTKMEVNAFQSGTRAGGVEFENRDHRPLGNEYQAPNPYSSTRGNDRRSSNYGPQRSFHNKGHKRFQSI